METKEILSRAKEEMLAQLIELAAEGRRGAEAERYRERARHLIQEIGVAEKALNSISPGPSFRFAPYKRAIEAILDVLNEVGYALTEDELVKALIDGGFRGGAPGTKLVIQKSIRSYTMGTGLKTAKKHPERGIKILNGLIGRADWDKSSFKQ